MRQFLFAVTGITTGAALVWVGDYIRWRRDRRQRRYELCRDAVGAILTAWAQLEGIRLAASPAFGGQLSDTARDKHFERFKAAISSWLLALESAKLAPLSDEAMQLLSTADHAATQMTQARRDFDQLDASRQGVLDTLPKLVHAIRQMAP